MSMAQPSVDTPPASDRQQLAVWVLFVGTLYLVATGSLLVSDGGIYPLALRLGVTALLLAGFAVSTARDPVTGLIIFVCMLIPQKILINQGIVLNSATSLQTLVLIALFLRRPVLSQSAGMLIYAALFSYAGFHYLLSDRSADATNGILGFATFGAFFYLIAPRIHAAEALQALRGYAGFIVVFAALALLSYDWSTLDRLGPGLALNSNNAAQFTAIGVILTLYLRRVQPGHLAGLIALAALAMVLLLVGSRTFLVVAALGAFLAINPLRSALVLALISPLLILATSFIVLQDSGVLLQLTKGIGTGTFEDLSTKRWLLTLRAFEVYLQSPPFGAGLGSSAELIGLFREASGRFLPVHNVYLLYLVEFGITGPILIAAWTLALLTGAIRRGRTLCTGLTVAFTASGLISGSFFDPEYAAIWAIAYRLSLRDLPPPASPPQA